MKKLSYYEYDELMNEKFQNAPIVQFENFEDIPYIELLGDNGDGGMDYSRIPRKNCKKIVKLYSPDPSGLTGADYHGWGKKK